MASPLPISTPFASHPDAPRVPSPDYEKAVTAANKMQAVRALVQDVDIQHFVALCDKNMSLRAANETLAYDLESQDRRFARLLSQLDKKTEESTSKAADLESLRKEKLALVEKLGEAQVALKEKQKEIERRDAEVAEEIEKLKEELKYQRREIEGLRELSVKLEPVGKSQKDMIKLVLNKTFSLARRLAETHFNVDLPRKVVSNTDLWKAIKEHPAVVKDITLPVSNTLVAKQTRTAAFLAILRHQICEHIFQPTYLLRDSTELNKILGHVANEDLEQEAHAHSVLLRLSEMNPESADVVASSHVDRAVKNVCDTVHGLISMDPKTELTSKELKDRFESEIHAFFTQACEQWKPIQLLDVRVEPYSSAEGTKPLFAALPESSGSGGNNTKSRPNGTGPAQNAGKKSDSANNDSHATTTAFFGPVVIWPTFVKYSPDAANGEPLAQGYQLTLAQVAAARSEEIAQQPTGPRRNQRQSNRASRSMSIGGSGLESGIHTQQNGSVVGSGAGSSVSFLSQGPGGGRKGT